MKDCKNHFVVNLRKCAACNTKVQVYADDEVDYFLKKQARQIFEEIEKSKTFASAMLYIRGFPLDWQALKRKWLE